MQPDLGLTNSVVMLPVVEDSVPVEELELALDNRATSGTVPGLVISSLLSSVSTPTSGTPSSWWTSLPPRLLV